MPVAHTNLNCYISDDFKSSKNFPPIFYLNFQSDIWFDILSNQKNPLLF